VTGHRLSTRASALHVHSPDSRDLTSPKHQTAMRPQARAFSIEIKSRKRSTSRITASAARRDDWADVNLPDDLTERDVHEGLDDAPVQSEARRAAERVFNRLNGKQPSVAPNEPTAPEAPAPGPASPAARVLPDLLAAAREEERTKVDKPERKRAAKALGAKRSEKKPDPQIRFAPLKPLAPDHASPSPVLTTCAEASFSRARRAVEGHKRLPRGQRWKERRLPKVCWDR
jgi:hypothetical protein